MRQRFDLWPWISDLEGKNSKFRRALRFCVWPFCTCLCIYSILESKLYDKFGKMSKNCQNWPVYHPWWPWLSDLDIGARKYLFYRCIHLPSFVEIRKWEGGQNDGTYRRHTYAAGTEHLYICVAADKNHINTRILELTVCNIVVSVCSLEKLGKLHYWRVEHERPDYRKLFKTQHDTFMDDAPIPLNSEASIYDLCYQFALSLYMHCWIHFISRIKQ